MTVPILGGRPLAFETPEEMETKIYEYFACCDEQKEISVNDKGQSKVIQKPYTISGLCIYLGISKETWSQYLKRPEYTEITAMAKLQVENYVEENSLMGKINPVMSIFNLKNNFGWTDRFEVSANAQTEQLSSADIQAHLATRRASQLESNGDPLRIQDLKAKMLNKIKD
jgi:hypothetical protein